MRRFAANVALIITGDAVRRLFGFLTIAYLARTITTADFGIMNIGFTVLSYALMAASGGLSTLGTREIAGGADRSLVSSLLGLKFVSALATYAIVAAVVLAFVVSAELSSLILVLCGSLVVQALFLDWFFQGKEQMLPVMVARCASAVVYFVLAITLVHSPADLLRIGVAAVSSDVIAVFAVVVMYQREFGPLKFSSHNWNILIRRAVPLGSGAILAHFSINLPPIIIGLLLTNADVGVFSAASKMVFFLLMFDRVLGAVLLPASARLFAADPAKLAGRLDLMQKWIFIVALPICAGGTLLAGHLIPFIFGEQYVAAVPVFRIFIWYLLVTMIHTVFTTSIVAVGKEKEYSRVMLVSAAIYAVSIVVSTKLFGIAGAAAAVVASEAVTLLLMRRAFHASVKTSIPRSLPAILLAVVVMSAAVLLLGSLHLVLLILIGALVYASVLFITRTLSVAEVAGLVKQP